MSKAPSYRFILITILTIGLQEYAQSTNRNKAKNHQLKVGNLALPMSQQPSPLFSIGQNIVDQHDFLYQGTFSKLKGPQQNFVGMLNSLIYGIKDDLSILFGIPIAISFMEQCFRSSGIGDIIMQAEYAPYTDEKYTAIDQITVIGTLLVPTGSVAKKPNTGLGRASFFIGSTISRTAIKWYLFSSCGTLLRPAHHCTRFGYEFLYEAGVGYNLGNPGGNILLGLVECNGIRSHSPEIHQRRGIGGLIENGNVIFVGPGLFFSSHHAMLQLGIQFPITQRFADRSSEIDFRAAIAFTWKF